MSASTLLELASRLRFSHRLTLGPAAGLDGQAGAFEASIVREFLRWDGSRARESETLASVRAMSVDELEDRAREMLEHFLAQP